MNSYEELNKFVKGKKRINFFNFNKLCKAIENIVIDEIRKIGFTEPEYKLYCVIKDNRGYEIDTLGEQIYNSKRVIVNVNTKLLDGLEKIATTNTENEKSKVDNFSRIDLFLIIFHELEHVRQAKMYQTNTVDNMDLYKDKVLSIYFNHLKDDNGYYAENYKVTTEEVFANIKGIERTIDYFNQNNIEFTKVELEILKSKMDKYKKLLTDRERINPINNKKYNIDELYNMVLKDDTYEFASLLNNNIKR